MTETETHAAIPLYWGADNCDHPAPVAVNGRGEYQHGKPEYSEWDEWNDNHPYGREGERLCLLSPLGRTGCPACTETAAEEEDLPIGEYVACRVAAA